MAWKRVLLYTFKCFPGSAGKGGSPDNPALAVRTTYQRVETLRLILPATQEGFLAEVCARFGALTLCGDDEWCGGEIWAGSCPN